MAFKVLQVDHIGIGVNDLAATKEFYKNALGMNILLKTKLEKNKREKDSSFLGGKVKLKF